MTFTHEELLNAVREAGRDRESFTCADVRRCLGIASKDKKELSSFHRRFRAFQAAAPKEIEKLGNNRYRLRAPALAPAEKVAVRARAAAPKRTHRPVRAAAEIATDTLATAAPEPAVTAPVATLEIDTASDVVVTVAAKREDDTIELTDEMLELVLDPNGAPAIPRVALDVHIEPISSEPESRDDVFAQPAPNVDVVAVESEAPSALQLPLAALRAWRDRGQWLGRRFAEIFSRA